jgi:hypothetical protein
MASRKQPRIVAELGRPETPEETAARKAENSRLYRSRKTINNLVLSLLVTVGAVAVLFFLVPRAETAPNWQVDYVSLSAQAAQQSGRTLIVPSLPATWQSNAAQMRTSTDGVSSWYIGFITPTNQYIGYEQALRANPSWVSAQVKNFPPTGARSIDGRNWVEFDHRTLSSAGNAAYALSLTVGDATYLLYGTAPTEEFLTLAHAISADLP